MCVCLFFIYIHIHLFIYLFILYYIISLCVFACTYVLCILVYIYICVCAYVCIYIYIYGRGSLGKLVWIYSFCGFTEARNTGNCRWVFSIFALPLLSAQGEAIHDQTYSPLLHCAHGGRKISHGTKQSQKMRLTCQLRRTIVY